MKLPGFLTICRRSHVAALLSVLATPTFAQVANVVSGPWQNVQGAQVRLILPAAPAADSALPRYAGVEVRLQKDTKTYWRSPGETGVAPNFDFAGSQGVAEMTPLFPTPTAFDDGAGGIAYGYTSDVVFPIRLRQTGSTANLAVTFDFGICTKTMCVPAAAKLSGTPGQGSPDAEGTALLSDAVAQVPKPVDLRASAPLAIDAATLRNEGDRQIITVDAHAPAEAQPLLFIESDEPFSHPKREKTSAGWRFIAERPRLAAGRPVGDARLTLAVGTSGIETVLSLDKVGAK